MVRLVSVSGSHYEMGWQHGLQVKDLRPLILKAIEGRLSPLSEVGKIEYLTEELLKTFHDIATPTLGMIRGQAAGLGVDFLTLFRYDCISYFEDSLLVSGVGEGCSTWAASNSATRTGEPILVKNRDYYLEHLPLQIMVEAEPENRYRYIYVSSAGSPGVFGSGMNEKGLCVADTRVRCLDHGPGLPSYSLMMCILEQHGSVPSALNYLKQTRRMGGSNLILADAQGNLGAFEVAHENYGLIETSDHLLVNTNHFVSPGLVAQFVDTNPPESKGNSFHRYKKLEDELHASYGKIDVALAKRLMAFHAGSLTSICRHEETFMDKKVGTISGAIYLPLQRKLLFCNGHPCLERYQTFTLVD